MLMNGLRLVHGFFIAHLCLSPPYGSIVPWYLWRTCGEMAECVVGRTVKAMIGCTKQVRTIPRRHFCLLGQLPASSVDSPLSRMPSGWSGSFTHCEIFESGRSACSLAPSLIEISNDSLHRILFISTNSANGRLQSTSVSGPENRQRRVWVDSGLSRSLDDVSVPGRLESFENDDLRTQSRHSARNRSGASCVYLKCAAAHLRYLGIEVDDALEIAEQTEV